MQSGPETPTLKLAYLYPEQMNIYGDRGNIIALQQRCAWRGISLSVVPINTGDHVDWHTFDMAFFGGGQDSGQALVAQDFLTQQSDALGKAIEDGLVMLAICGGYQLLGHYFLTHTGERLPGAGILDVHTIGGKKRMIGNTVIELHTPSPQSLNQHHATSMVGASRSQSTYLVGFENHSGRTYHGAKVQPLGHVVVGYGDNGEDKISGSVYRNTIGCYLHGSLLPKNPHIADHMLTLALQKKYGRAFDLYQLNDTMEWEAHHTMVDRLLH